MLVAEDNDDDFQLIRRAMRKVDETIDVRRGVDGAEALKILEEADNLPFLALLDIKMPRVSGLQVLERIRADERTQAIPAVILTSSDEPSDVVSAYRLGCSAYVRKPVDYETFMSSMQLAMRFWLTSRTPY